jgi:hypothetical protein
MVYAQMTTLTVGRALTIIPAFDAVGTSAVGEGSPLHEGVLILSVTSRNPEMSALADS